MNARGVQIIRLAPDRFVLKRGVHELVVTGAAAGTAIEPLLALLDGTRAREEIVRSFPGDLRGDVDELISALLLRGMISPRAETESATDDEEGLQAAFYRNFGAHGLRAPERLKDAEVIVVGVNLITRTLARGLLECGVGRVILVDHPVLSDHLSSRWLSPLREQVTVLDALPGEPVLRQASLLCAVSQYGEAEALLQVNRLAIQHERPFLPVWITEMVGSVGPLNHPRETACLRCYRLRADSNDSKYETSRAIRAHMSADPEAAHSVGLLPPIAGAVGEIAAMEVIKFLGGFLPTDAVGRIIQINLMSFSSAVRRVLKVPRCPDCSDQNRRAPMALWRGPQITQRE